MHRVAIAVLLAAISVAAQTIIDDPVKIADAEKLIETYQADQLRCTVTPIKPRFNPNSATHAGYVWRVRLDRPLVDRERWLTLTRITPQGASGHPVYLSEVLPFPSGATAGLELESGIFYWVGESSYQVTWLLFDGHGAGCRKDWQVDARLTAAERKAGPGLLAPGTVSLRPPPPKRTGPVIPAHITILLDAAVMRPGHTVFGEVDRGLLLGNLSRLMEGLPVLSVRLVVFYLGQQKEVFHRDGFTIDALPEVARVMSELQPSLVDYSVLQKPGGELELIERLINSELRAPQPSDAVIFLGPRMQYKDAIPPGSLDEAHEIVPRFYYMECGWDPSERGRPALMFPSGGRGGGSNRASTSTADSMPSDVRPDSIQRAVAQLKGTTMESGTTEEFAKAVAKIRRALEPYKGGIK